MKLVKKISKALCISLVIAGASYTISYADPGNMEAINSASEDLRNIVGIEISTATESQKMAVGCTDVQGVFVSAVIPKRPAETAGLMSGDIITKIDEKSVTDHSEALEVINGLDAGRRYSFDICRIGVNGIPQKLTKSVLVEKVQEKAIGKIS